MSNKSCDLTIELGVFVVNFSWLCVHHKSNFIDNGEP